MDPFRNYDAWLEAPFQQMCKEADDYIDFCEGYDIDPDRESSETAYAEYLEDSTYYDDFEEQEEWYNVDTP